MNREVQVKNIETWDENRLIRTPKSKQQSYVGDKRQVSNQILLRDRDAMTHDKTQVINSPTRQKYLEENGQAYFPSTPKRYSGSHTNPKVEARNWKSGTEIPTPALNHKPPKSIINTVSETERREMWRQESPNPAGKQYPWGHIDTNSPQIAQRNFSSPRSERGFNMQKINVYSPTRSEQIPYQHNYRRRPAPPNPMFGSSNDNLLDSQCSQFQAEDVRQQIYALPLPVKNKGGLGQRSLTQQELRDQESHQDRRIPVAETWVTSGSDRVIKKGFLWLQQDKLFSRWKERFVILTTEYLQVFKKTSSVITQMGNLLFQVHLSKVTSISLEDRRGYLTLAVITKQEGKLLLRRTEGIVDWHLNLEYLVQERVREGERGMQSTREFWDRRQKSDSHGAQNWLLTRDNTGQKFSYPTPPSGQRMFSVSSPRELQPETHDDSGFESLVTTHSTNSDAGSTVSPGPVWKAGFRASSPASSSLTRFSPDAFKHLQINEHAPTIPQKQSGQKVSSRYPNMPSEHQNNHREGPYTGRESHNGYRSPQKVDKKHQKSSPQKQKILYENEENFLNQPPHMRRNYRSSPVV